MTGSRTHSDRECVLLVEQAQRDPDAPQLDVDRRRVRLGPRFTVQERRRVHPRVELLVAQRLDLGPADDLRALRARDHLRRAADADADRARDLAMAAAVHPLQSKDLCSSSRCHVVTTTLQT